MEKVEFLRTKTLREELVLCLSLDGTCKVHVAGVQGVLLMVLTSYEGMSTLSSHMVAGVLMVLTAHKGMSTLSSYMVAGVLMVLITHKGISTLSSHMVAGVLIVLTAHKEMSTLSSTVTHKSSRVLYNYR